MHALAEGSTGASGLREGKRGVSPDELASWINSTAKGTDGSSWNHHESPLTGV